MDEPILKIEQLIEPKNVGDEVRKHLLEWINNVRNIGESNTTRQDAIAMIQQSLNVLVNGGDDYLGNLIDIPQHGAIHSVITSAPYENLYPEQIRTSLTSSDPVVLYNITRSLASSDRYKSAENLLEVLGFFMLFFVDSGAKVGGFPMIQLSALDKFMLAARFISMITAVFIIPVITYKYFSGNKPVFTKLLMSYIAQIVFVALVTSGFNLIGKMSFINGGVGEETPETAAWKDIHPVGKSEDTQGPEPIFPEDQPASPGFPFGIKGVAETAETAEVVEPAKVVEPELWETPEYSEETGETGEFDEPVKTASVIAVFGLCLTKQKFAIIAGVVLLLALLLFYFVVIPCFKPTYAHHYVQHSSPCCT